MLFTDVPNIVLILLSFLLFTNIGLVFFVIRNELRMRRMLKGNQIADFEKFLISVEKELQKFNAFRAHTEDHLKTIAHKIKMGARKMGLVKFYPFGQKTGGDQSFALAIVNEEGDGVVLSSLNARERVALFTKPIEKNKSLHELSAEEKRALLRAHTSYESSAQ